MLRVRVALTVFALVSVPALAAAQFEALKVEGGRVALHFEEAMLEAHGLSLENLVQTADSGDALAEGMEVPLVSFLVDDSTDLLFLVGRSEGFVPYGVIGGTVTAFGGFELVSKATGQRVDFQGFRIYSTPVENDGPGGEPDPDYFFMAQAGNGLAAPRPEDGDFLLCYVKISFDPEGEPYTPGGHSQPQVLIKAWDLIVTEALARKLGQPELEGLVLGTGKIVGGVAPFGGSWTYPPGQNPWTPYAGGGSGGAADGGTGLDVKLGILNSIKQLGHVGTYPDGRVGMATATTSCNVGDVDVPWLKPMNEDHPGITQSLYRQMGDRFEQVGAAWVKHGFFALSSSQCTPCQNGSPNGTWLGVGCSDTYGTSNNGDRFYLGPRDEWNPITAEWTACGSFFDGIPVDCLRDQGGSGFGPVDHRLEAFDYDLGLAGAQYFYEANYLVRNDVNLINNIGSRECTMSWNGSSWSFSTPSGGNPLIEGPAINRYGEFRSEAAIKNGGSVVLAVQTRDLGNGLWRYEYALYNWNLDRKVRSFSVPSCGNATDFYFHDIDDLPENDWVPVESGGNLTWTFPDVFPAGHKVAGPLEYSTLYNFGFTSTAPPASRNAALGIHDPGPGGNLLGTPTLAPECLNLTASSLSPTPNVVFDLVMTGGSGQAMLALLEVGGVPLADAPLIGPFPFVGGVASLTGSMPASASGLSFLLIGAEVTTSPLTKVAASNLLTLEVQ
jgi:hypothetical protein